MTLHYHSNTYYGVLRTSIDFEDGATALGLRVDPSAYQPRARVSP